LDEARFAEVDRRVSLTGDGEEGGGQGHQVVGGNSPVWPAIK
jgi:hypothetical protein